MKSKLEPDCARRPDMAVAAFMLTLATCAFVSGSPWLIDQNYIQVNQPEALGQQHLVLGIVQDNTPSMASNQEPMMITGFIDAADEDAPDTLSAYEATKDRVSPTWSFYKLWTFDPDYYTPTPPTFVQAAAYKHAFWSVYDDDASGDALYYSRGPLLTPGEWVEPLE